ncbi:MAG: hypothetical protein U9R58_08385 [Chloroflexota bacterium]|nr:hypothetical protein [Chloroflexota bacterium]
MEYTIQVLIERLTRFRKQLADLESRRAEYGADVPSEIWQELFDVSRWLDREERKAQAAGRIKSKHVNDTRANIIETLEQYNHWREQMREVEALFLSNIVRPGYRLKQAVRQREYLEGEYQRIRRGIETGKYSGIEELDEDVRRVLSHGDTAFDADRETFEDEVLQEVNPYEGLTQFDVYDLVEEFEKDHLVRDFKRVVLPAVHPDTSDTAVEVFVTVFEVYEKRDFLLMEAYIVEYRGEIEPDPDEDPVEFLESACAYQDKYQALHGRLERRVEHLVQDLTPPELKDPEKVRRELRRQRDEIRDRIQTEAERILQLREKLEGLAQVFLDRKSYGEEEL